MRVPFIEIEFLGVCAYLILMLIFLNAEKNKIMHSFALVLAVLICWTGGSLLMRLNVWPGYGFWFRISLTSLMADGFLLSNFLYTVSEVRKPMLRRIWVVIAVVMLVVAQSEFFLKIPDMVNHGDYNTFVYDVTWRTAIPAVLPLIAIIQAIMLIRKGSKKEGFVIAGIKPILFGVPIMLIGTFLAFLPGMVFPIDVACGIIYALLVAYAFYKKRLINKEIFVSDWVTALVAIFLTGFISRYTIDTVNKFLSTFIPEQNHYSYIIIVVLFISVAFLLYKLLTSWTHMLNSTDEVRREETLREYTVRIAGTLDSDIILKELSSSLKELINADEIIIYIYDKNTMTYKLSPLSDDKDMEDMPQEIKADDGIVSMLAQKEYFVITTELDENTLRDSLSDETLKMYESYNIKAMMPLRIDEMLYGLVLIILDSKLQTSSIATTSVQAMQNITSLALKNADMYLTMKREANEDSLTGLMSRRAFSEAAHNFVETHTDKSQSISLININLDGFKLFNQLYGNHNGDLALRAIADIIKRIIPSDAIAGRIGGKEYAIMIPECDSKKAMALTLGIKKQLADLSKDPRNGRYKTLTFSAGVASIPEDTFTCDGLIECADLAMYYAKKSGKDKIVEYSKEEMSNEAQDSGQDKYADYASTIYALTAAIDAKDHYTFNHSINVSYYATALAKAIGINEKQVEIIKEAALLHDIGKIAIPENILGKPTRLTPEEDEIMRTHVMHCVEIVKHLPSLDYVIPVAIGHHERWDGKGYPRELTGEEIPLGARCLCIADAFDAMVSGRPYREKLPTEEALKELTDNAGKQFDPSMVPVFVELVHSHVIEIQTNTKDE